MSAPPVVAWWTVQAFIDHLLGQAGRRYRQFPVVDMEGRLAGVVSMADLASCPPADRRNIAVQQLARPLPGELEKVLRSTRIVGGGALAAVVADDHVVGVLTGTDIARAVETNALRSTPESTR